MTTVVEAINNQYQQMKDDLRKQMLENQKRCAHPAVVHYPNNDGSRPSFPRRICLECGIEEIGSWWSYEGHMWSEKNFGHAILGNQEGRSIRVVEALDEFCRLRPCV